MNILFNINTPAQVHVFKNLIRKMRADNNLYIASRNSPIINKLLTAYEFDSFLIPYNPTKALHIIGEALNRLNIFSFLSSKCDLDIVVGGLDPFALFATTVVSNKTYKLCFADSRPNLNPLVPLQYAIKPFVDNIVTFDAVRKYEGYDYGSKKIEVPSYKELAYLHPDVFNPNKKILSKYNIGLKKEYVILRFSGWTAYHDVGQRGFSVGEKLLLVRILEQYFDVYISSENQLPTNLKKYELLINPEDIHDILYFSKFVISDSGTMTTEAGVLGVPTIRCNSFVGKNDFGNFIELEKKYKLVYNVSTIKDVIKKSLLIINKKNIKKEWLKKRKNMLKDKINLTDFLMWFIINYPESIYEHKSYIEQARNNIIHKYK